MTSIAVDKRWTKFELPPAFNELIHPKPIKINHHQFVITSYYSKSIKQVNNNDKHGIYLYDTQKNQCQQIAKYPFDLYPSIFYLPAAKTYNEINHKLYFPMFACMRWKLISFNLKTKQFDTNDPINKLTHCDEWEEQQLNQDIISLGKFIHFIGGYANKQHTLLHTNAVSFEVLKHRQFAEMKQIYGAKWIYVKSKQILILIGGIRSHEPRNVFGKPFGIWRYCINLKKWEEVKGLSFTLQLASAVLSSDEKYVIIAGGYNVNGHKPADESNKLFVLDIRDDNDWKLRECMIKTPIPGHHNMVAMGGNIKSEQLVIGWIKKIFKETEMNHLSLPPMYFVKMLILWYDQESIYWIQYSDSGNSYYVMTLKHILSALK